MTVDTAKGLSSTCSSNGTQSQLSILRALSLFVEL